MAQLAMLFDLTRCVGCYACVVACKVEHGTRPYVNYNQVKKLEWGEYPRARQRFLMTMCMKCENPPCVDVCLTKASFKTEDGNVLIDYEKCIGCGLCLSACQYEQRFMVKENITSFPGFIAPYEEESVKRIDIVEKCNFCVDRVSKGLKPACVHNCPGKCRISGDVDDPQSDISKYIAKTNATKIEGTHIYYVVPEGMDKSLLPVGAVKSAIAPAAPVVPEQPTKSEDSNYIVPLAVAGTAAVAVGVELA